MDPLTQGFAGAALPQAAVRRTGAATAGLLGFLAGMAPDLDVLIRSSEDPLLFLEYHRQFTHSLVIIPFGGALCALLLHPLLGRRRGLTPLTTWLCCTLGYATHALLDACTTYGTQLFWPFSDVRVAWNVVSIIDPLFSLPLALAVGLAARTGRRGFAVAGLCWALAYLGLGVLQREQARALGEALARERGHAPVEVVAKPGFANILVWKTVYRAEGRFFVDAMRTGWAPLQCPGESLAVLDRARDLPWLDPASQQARDVERFRWFSAGYVALAAPGSDRVIDIRYSLVPNEIDALWSLQLNRAAEPAAHGAYRVHRGDSQAALPRLWHLLWAADC
ncbi:metal-dependent hydrolase [Pseudohaliea rubra]|uniref:Integral membrane protein n=1 Tax=Pseudohaliea rubra DSM 19751 TaxID=1265313 RepID=A0A095VQE2_9GAMM|nr:metal-dependent hydrolase [Pseudohaliea rubra]KGE03652.1 Integral membrane protein [Pseudohaliea rubra DSM 19751]